MGYCFGRVVVVDGVGFFGVIVYVYYLFVIVVVVWYGILNEFVVGGLGKILYLIGVVNLGLGFFSRFCFFLGFGFF